MISVVIPAYNEELLLGACLDALTKQKTSRAFEVILVDNNSTDHTQDIARRYERVMHVRIIFEAHKGRGQARKTGFDHAQGDTIASTDADTVVPATWVENIGTVFEKRKDVIAITGPSTIHDCNRFTNATYNTFQPVVLRMGALLARHQWLNGFNFAVRKDAYRVSGGFNPNLRGQEDWDLAIRLAKVGKMLFIPELSIEFSGRRFKRGLIAGLFDYMKSVARYVRPNGDGYLSDVR